MMDFWQQSVASETLTQAQMQTHLASLRTQVNADYVQGVLIDDSKIKSTCNSFSNGLQADELLPERVTSFAQKLDHIEKHLIIPSGTAPGKKLNGDASRFTYWLTLPIKSEAPKKAFLFLAFSNDYPTTTPIIESLVHTVAKHLVAFRPHTFVSPFEKDQKKVQAFTQALNSINNRGDFWQLIDTTLRELISFSACTFFLNDEDREEMHNFFSHVTTIDNQSGFNKTVPRTNRSPNDNNPNAHPEPNKSIGLDLETVLANEDLRIYLHPENQARSNFGILFELQSGIKSIGYCLMVFTTYSSSNTCRHKLSTLMPHLTATILRIGMQEDIERIGRELEILEAINLELAINKDKNELLRDLHPHLSQLFPFSHHFVAMVDHDRFTISLLLQDSVSKAKLHPKYHDIVETPFHINDHVFNKVLLSNDPVTFDLDQLASKNTLPPYMLINYESGIKKMIMVNLQIDGLRIGIWGISLFEDQSINKRQLNNIKSISSQISIAARDFRNQEILAKQHIQQNYLAQINAEIATIKNRENLRRFLTNTLRKRFNFNGVSILTFNDDKTCQLHLHTYDRDDQLEKTYAAMQGHHFLISDRELSGLMDSQDVFNCDMEDLASQPGVTQHLLDEYEAGIHTKIGFRLMQGDHLLGVMFYHLSAHPFSDQDLQLLTNISLQIATSVTHILALEDIEERQCEREMLFALSIQVASVGNHDELADVISNELKNHIGFNHIAIGRLDDEQKNFHFIFLDPASEAHQSPSYPSLKAGVFSVQDEYTQQILGADKPVLFDLERDVDSAPCPLYIRLNAETGIGKMIGIKLSRNGCDFGFLLLFFKSPCDTQVAKTALIKAIGHHIATAVYHLIANQEIKELLSVRAQLLKFGIELRMVRDEMILSRLLDVQLRTLFGAENYLITAFDDHKLKHRPIFYDREAELMQMPDFLSWINHHQDLSNNFFDKLKASDKPIIFPVEEIHKHSHAPMFVKRLSVDNGMGFVGAVMKLGGEAVGFILFQHENPERILQLTELFTNILSQIAIVIVNITSHQKVEEQLKEIERYKMQLEEEKTYLVTELESTNNYTDIIGESPALRKTFHLVSQVAASSSTVLILGETGTGKELIARALHNHSPRKHKMMVKVNCAALPPHLIESELFGHERGSFTGATDRRIGKFELANGGTLFLDEIGEMPLDLQVKLLRVLQEKEVERVGGRGVIKVDVRIVAATNRDLEKEVSEGRFRSDLFYRLNIFPIFLPPLRERKEDIGALVYHFLRHFSKKTGKSIDSISVKALQDLQRYSWPGNVRELEHMIERSVLLTNSNVIKEVSLPTPKAQMAEVANEEQLILKTIDQNEKEHIYRVLQYCAGRISGRAGAAEILGIPPTTLNSRMKRLGIKRTHML